MNKNIEVINKNLWAVNFEYVKAGWVKDVDLKQTKSDAVFCLLDGGIILINKKFANYMDMVLWVSRIMKLSDAELGTIKGFLNLMRKAVPCIRNYTDKQLKARADKNDMDEAKGVYRACSCVERKRRLLKKQHKKGG